jgi:dTDP-4-amino-4,6-dideoxygalactose transaminase
MILINDFKAEPQEMRDAMLAAASRVLGSGWYILGDELTAFEREWARACGVEYAIGVGNGMDAIEISLRLLDIGPGDEVITTPMTAFATVLAIVRAGATPVLADIERETALLSFESVRRCISPRTKAIVPVHLYGQIRDTAAWQSLCVEKGIELVEDCAQAHLATLDGKVAGTFGRLGAYSFYPTKNLGALGDAGAIITNDAGLAKRAARLRNYGQSVRYHHPDLGMNSRLDEIQAAFLSVRLGWLEGFTARRREIARSYFAEMHNPLVSLMAEPVEPAAHVYHLFVVTCPHRDALQAHLESRDIQSLIHYPIPVHHQESCRQIGRDPLGLSVSEQHAASCLSIPCHPQLSDNDVQAVIAAVNAFEVD